jgi:hypothetical protein
MSQLALKAGVIEAAEPPEPFALLDYEGNLRADADPQLVPQISDVDCLRLYRELLKVRLVDERMMKLQRQGRLGFYMKSLGEEATHFGVAYGLRDSDWVYPSYREPGVAFFRGYSISDFTNQLFGNAEDPIKGRQMPVHHSFRAGNFVSISSPVGTQIPQAVGTAAPRRSSSTTRWSGVLWGRHDLAGRLPRRAELRRGVESAGDLRLSQQRLGDLDAAHAADCVAEHGAQGTGIRLPGLSSMAMTSWR